MNESILAIMGAIVGFLGKSAWDLYWKRRLEHDRLSHLKRLEFIERQLSEFYWPLFFQLQKNNVVWQRVLSGKDRDDGLAAEIDYKMQREFFFPNNEEVSRIIEQKFHLSQPDEQLQNFIVRFMRHQAVFKAIRDSGRLDIDPIRFGEPWPDGFFEVIEKRTKALQEEYDREIGKGRK